MPRIYANEYAALEAATGTPGRYAAAVPAGRYKGRNAYRVPVLIRENSSRQCATVGTRWLIVLARGAAEAADYVRDRIDRPETEIIAIGPRGGLQHRYVGWHSAIARGLIGAGRVPVQFNLI